MDGSGTAAITRRRWVWLAPNPILRQLATRILGGALVTPVMGLVMDRADTNVGFIVPAICLAIVAAYALFDLRSSRHGGPLVAEGAAH